MGRVKKGGGSGAPRKTKRSATKPAVSGSGSRGSRAPARQAKARSGTARSGRAVVRGKSAKHVEVEKVIMRVRELDPRAKCGAGTSVQRLFRVDAVSRDASVTHLVFLDRHGLYCEHGRGCPAVAEVTRLDRTLKRNTQVG